MNRFLCAMVSVAWLWAGCDGKLADGVPEGPVTCESCHFEDPSVPLNSQLGTRTSADPAVGVHGAHLDEGVVHAALDCAACHPVPESIEAEGHLDGGSAEIAFGALAATGGLQPEWDAEARTCRNVYCHGASLSGGRVPEPVWHTACDACHEAEEGDRPVAWGGHDADAACSMCHGNPPPEPHPQSTDCNACHPDTVNSDGTLNVAGGRHIDGTIDAPAASCSACHGFPPAQPHPQSEQCHACHAQTAAPGGQLVPGTDTHINDNVEVGFTAESCGICHGNPPDLPHPQEAECRQCHADTVAEDGLILADGMHRDGDSDLLLLPTSCGLCHGNPPPEPHPQEDACEECHNETVNADGTLNVEGGKHRNFELDLAFAATSCGLCHGNPPALPHPQSDQCAACHAGTVGEDGTLLPAGMHRDGDPDIELTVNSCSLCHGNPPAAPHPQSNQCAACHADTVAEDGAILPEGKHRDDNTDLLLTQASCALCHGFPPAPPHPEESNCNECHGATVDDNNELLPGADTHRNDETDFLLAPSACGKCHGLPPGGDHPPMDNCSQCHGCVATDDQELVPGSESIHPNGSVNFESPPNCP